MFECRRGVSLAWTNKCITDECCGCFCQKGSHDELVNLGNITDSTGFCNQFGKLKASMSMR